MRFLAAFTVLVGVFSHLFKAICSVLVRAPYWGDAGMTGKTFKGAMLLTNALSVHTDKLYGNKDIAASCRC